MTGDNISIGSTDVPMMTLICAKHGVYGNGPCCFCELDDLRAKVEELSGEMPAVFAEIRAERAKQDAKWGEQNHDDFTWLAILTEEIGELAQAALHDQFGGKAAGTLRSELVQAAAVAVAWIECIDRRSNDD